jgi:glycosyltransferase involved in cell wall biosynthesis
VYRVALYCPDRHLTYDAATPERTGVGGGVTARLRLARALAEAGCRVQLVANVLRPQRLGRLALVPLDRCRGIDCDVLVLNTTGGALDLSPVLELEVRARLREVWVGGEARVQGLDAVGYDFLVAPSNYIRRIAGESWGVPAGRRLVVPNGVPEPARGLFTCRRERDPFRLVYTGHPSKGLEAAFGLLRRLRAEDRRYRLDVFGGPRLWGQAETPLEPPEGVVWHGLVGQRKLGAALARASFSVNLQGIADGFGIALAEAMAAGCIAVASRIGAYPELIRHGYDGFLLAGPHDGGEVLDRAARLIHGVAGNPGLAALLRRNAAASPLAWPVVARAWIGHWERALGRNGGSPGREPDWGSCPECGGSRFALADGYHCSGCGFYARDAVAA